MKIQRLSKVAAAGLMTLLGGLTLGSVAQAQSLYGPNCPNYAARSPSSNQAMTMRVVNDSSEPADLYWVDFRGNLKFYKRIFQRDVFTQPTYAGHLWIAWQGNRCEFWWTANPTQSQITLR
ncbi:MAG: hypothetical protein AAGM04_13760 [Pseudomonadota bacterium]